jgi:hypothetical protein
VACRTTGVLAVPAVVAGLGMPAVAAGILVVIVAIVALCWVLADDARSDRAARLIAAGRRAKPFPRRPLSEASSQRNKASG